MEITQHTIQDVMELCPEFLHDENDLKNVLEANASGGGLLTPSEFLTEEAEIHKKGVREVVAFGPFSHGVDFNAQPVYSLINDLKEIRGYIWEDFVLSPGHEEIQKIRDQIKDIRFTMNEIPWASNSDTRIAYYFALDSIYSLTHAYRHYPKYKNLAFVFCLAEYPFTGFKKTKEFKPELSISAIEVRTILDMIHKGYQVPPVYFLHGLFSGVDINNYSDIKKYPAAPKVVA